MKDYKYNISRAIDGNYIGLIRLGSETAYTCHGTTEQSVDLLIAEWLLKKKAPLPSSVRPQQSSLPSVGVVPTTGYTGSLKELLAAAVEIYRTTYSDRSLIIKNPRNEGRYLQMTFPDWPTLVHYEFLVHQKENFMGVELHVETDKSPAITTEMPLLCKSLQGQFGAYKLEYHPDWDKNGCRILVQVPADTTPESVAQTMANLVRLTSKTINDKLAST